MPIAIACILVYSTYFGKIPVNFVMFYVILMIVLAGWQLLFCMQKIVCVQRVCLKGIPLELADLRINVHYFITKAVDEELCRLGIYFPKVDHFTPLFQTAPIKEAAEEQGIPFVPGLEFFIREDEKIVFVHPVPTDPK